MLNPIISLRNTIFCSCLPFPLHFPAYPLIHFPKSIYTTKYATARTGFGEVERNFSGY